jgi:hypothetical protein
MHTNGCACGQGGGQEANECNERGGQVADPATSGAAERGGIDRPPVELNGRRAALDGPLDAGPLHR